jgi:acyl-coenzyme A thioesterase PaaI-like protein
MGRIVAHRRWLFSEPFTSEGKPPILQRMAKRRALLEQIAQPLAGSGNTIRNLWDSLGALPAGSRLFGLLLGRAIPYTGSIHARVETLEPGFARVTMKDRPGLRNHLTSLHAIALANLAEYTGNLALAYSLPDDARFIVKSISLEYLKKARGTITGECRSPIPTNNERREYDLSVNLKDESGVEVARAILKTLVGPVG